MRARAVMGMAAAGAAAAAMLAFAGSGRAANADQAPVVATCLTCHGGAGVPAGDPAYTSPRLSGQHPDYLVRAIDAYRSGARKVALMHDQVAGLNRTQIAAAATVLAGAHPGPPKPGHAEPPAEVVQVCGGCHGETGMGVLPETPILSGQRADYLAHALNAYRSGERTNPIMRVYASRLTPAQVITLAGYFSAQGALKDAK